MLISISGKSECPQVKISDQELDFAEVCLNEKKSLVLNLTNHSQEKNIDVSFNKIPYVYVFPEQFKIKPQQIKSFTISFKPQKMGKYKKNLLVQFVDRGYEVPICIRGNCNKIGQALQKSETQRKSMNFMSPNFGGNFTDRKLFTPTSSANFSQNSMRSSGYDDFLITRFNKHRYNDFLKSQREFRDLKKFPQIKPTPTPTTKDEDDNNPPIDYEF